MPRNIAELVGPLRQVSDPRYLEDICRNVGRLADRLRFGTEDRPPVHVDRYPMSIGVVPGSGTPFGLTQIYGAMIAVTRKEGTPYISVEAHSFYGDGSAETEMLEGGEVGQPCSKDRCALSQAGLVLVPRGKGESYGTPDGIHASPLHAIGGGFLLERATDLVLDGADGFVEPGVPLDPRYDGDALRSLERFRQLGHHLLTPPLEKYAQLLTGASAPAPRSVSAS